MINAIFSGEKILSKSPEAFSLYEKSRFGEKVQSAIEYSLVETLFLFHENKMLIHSNSKPLNEEQLLKKLKRLDKKIETKLTVFSDLRKKGYVVKTALKFGADFRVYKKGSFPGTDHALWLVHSSRESDPFSWHEFSAKNRIAHSTKKKLLLAIVDEESSTTYYQVDWLKP
jgi:tRNA-intron endonuclease, archaea type